MMEYLHEHFTFPILVWIITGCLAFVGGWWIQKHKKDNQADINAKLGVIALLRLEMIKQHREYTRQGYCAVTGKETFQKLYDIYHKLGGNGTATELLEEIRGLPSSTPKE